MRSFVTADFRPSINMQQEKPRNVGSNTLLLNVFDSLARHNKCRKNALGYTFFYFRTMKQL